MKKIESSDVTAFIAVSLCMGTPVIACAVISLNLMLEYGDFFMSGMFFLLASLICLMIVNVFLPLVALFALMLDALWWLTKKTYFAVRNRRTHHPA